MTKTPFQNSKTTIQVRVDTEIKNTSDSIFNNLGITISDAVNIFLRQAIIHQGFPFDIKLKQLKKK